MRLDEKAQTQHFFPSRALLCDLLTDRQKTSPSAFV